MEIQKQHTMERTQQYPSGAEEWYCPTCGRRFVIQWPPVYKRIILDAGDEEAMHNGASEGLQLNATNVQPAEPQASPEAAESSAETGENIEPWLRFLKDVDVANLLDQEPDFDEDEGIEG